MINTSGFFESFFSHAKNNAVILMDTGGRIIRVNHAFENSFGYEQAELVGENFGMFFTPKDREEQKPEKELQKALKEKAASDNNFFIHKNGNQTWVTGESVLVSDDNGQPFILKVIHDINTEKILEKFLMEANDLIEIIFQTIEHTALLLLDSRMKIIKVNNTFCNFFKMQKAELEGIRLSNVTHSFLTDPLFQQDVREVFITNVGFKDKKLEMKTEQGRKKLMSVDTKLIDIDGNGERRMLVVIKDTEDAD